MQQDWVRLAENPTVEILLQVVADLQQRVLELEAGMVTLSSEHNSWATSVEASPDLWKPVRR